MADFAGMTVRVTLKPPHNTILHGKVKEVNPGKTLTLQNVFFPAFGTRQNFFTVQGVDIADIQVVDMNAPAMVPRQQQRGPVATAPPSQPVALGPFQSGNAPAPQRPTVVVPPQPAPVQSHSAYAPAPERPPVVVPPQPAPVQSHSAYAPAPQRPPVAAPHPTPVQSQPPTTLPIRVASGQPQRQPSDFVDPAILSYGKSPVQTKTASKPPEPATPIKSMLAKAAESLPSNGSPYVAEAGKSDFQKGVKTKDVMSQVLTPSVAAQTQNGDAEGKQERSQMDSGGAKKKVRRGQKKKAVPGSQDPPPVMNADVSRNGNDMTGNVKRGKGWRSTPLLQPSPQTSSPHDKDSSARKTRRQHQHTEEMQQNGWATEEATDIQDMGDFDFEANHRLFDKKQVFDQLRQGDTTADEDRLVSHNKLPHTRPGTYGGRNLHPTESVLSPQLGAKYHSNELDSSSDADTELNFAAANGGRSSSRHSGSRVAMKRQPSRQNSVPVEGRPHPLTASMSSDRGLGLNRSVTSLRNEAGKAVPSIVTSPRPDRTRSPQSAISATRTHAPSVFTSQPVEPHLAIYPTMASCPVLLPSALETLEAETTSRYGLTQDAITESAARCIAEMAMGMIDDSLGGSRRASRANTIQGSMASSLTLVRGAGAAPVLVILAGNHAAGARAAAAARHLVCRRTKIIVVEAQYESADTQDVQMKTQTAILKRMMRSGADIKRGPWRKAYNYIKNLSGPPAVIIDALLTGSAYQCLLESNAQHAEAAQKETREMIDWANRSRAPVLSVACPSGVSGMDGATTVLEGEPLAMRPDKVICLGAPMQGLLDAMKGGERWDVSLADVGINVALRRDEAVGFGGLWVTELKFVVDDIPGGDVL